MAPGAVKTIFRRETAAAEQGRQDARTHRRIRERFAIRTSPRSTAVDGDRGPQDLRRHRDLLEMLRTKRVDRPKRKHGNIPL